jgi:hypothetical protein
VGFDLAVYYRTIKINSQRLAIIFALLSLASRGEATTIVIIRTDTSIVIAPNKEHFWVLGQSTAALHVVKSSFLFGTGDYAADARRMVQVEIADVPQKVGPPIDVMVIDKAGQHWIDPTGSCGAKKRTDNSNGKSQHK